MLEGKLAFIQNRAHGTSSRYKLATTNHYGHDFSIGKLATAYVLFYWKAGFLSSIVCIIIL